MVDFYFWGWRVDTCMYTYLVEVIYLNAYLPLSFDQVTISQYQRSLKKYEGISRG